MADLYQEALEIAEQIKDVQLRIIDQKEALEKLEHALAVANAKVERSLIKKRGGEKNLAPTTADRDRIFILARAADETVSALQAQRDERMFEIERLNVQLSYLKEILNIKKILLQVSPDEL